jgi:hypothetical protein
MLLLLCATGMAQSPRNTKTNNNVWFMYFGSHKLSDKWGLHLEAQWRRSEWVQQAKQLLVRTGVNYHFDKNAFATLGYCFVQTHPYGAFPVRATFPEHRLWEQLQIKTQLGKVEIINRFRLEQRWLYLPVLKNNEYVPGSAVYQNRFRVLGRFSIPFKGKVIADKSFYLSAFDEIMVNFGKNVGNNVFDQNRAYVALGYKVPKLGRLELGYMQQLLLRSDGIRVENNHNLQLGLNCNIDFYKHK